MLERVVIPKYDKRSEVKKTNCRKNQLLAKKVLKIQICQEGNEVASECLLIWRASGNLVQQEHKFKRENRLYRITIQEITMTKNYG